MCFICPSLLFKSKAIIIDGGAERPGVVGCEKCPTNLLHTLEIIATALAPPKIQSGAG